jgi:hypothetical protein
MKERSSTRLGRYAALAGVAGVALTAAGDFTIGPFPDSTTPLPKLAAFYAHHHGRVADGGMLLGWAAILLAVFGVALWARIQASGVHPVIAGAALVGTAVATLGNLEGASSYWTLGHIGHEAAIAPAALQAWHIAGAEGGLSSSGGVALLLLAVTAAGILGRAFPRPLTWSAGVLAVLQLSPAFGFVASFVILVWIAVTSIVMVARPSVANAAARRDTARATFAGASPTPS